MPLRSMTGYGMAEASVSRGTLRVELKSVNHKSLDVRLSVPRGFGEFEQKMSQRIRERLGRGRVSVACEYRREAAAGDGVSLLGIDEERLGQVVEQLQGLKARHGLSGPIGFAELEPFASLYRRGEQEERVEELLSWEEVATVLDEALDRFERARIEEGAGIEQMFEAHLEELEERRALLEALRPRLLEGYHERLRDRLEALSQAHGGLLDQERIVTEVHYFTEKTDIAEELQRAHAHIERLQRLIAGHEGESIGKKLDFYLQEMIRETNTMASKSNFAELTGHVIEMKSRIEQLREQSANVE